MSHFETAKRIIARMGATYTLQRRTIGAGSNAWTPGTVTTAFVQCKAREREYFAKEIGASQGGIQQGDTELTIDAATITGRPTAGDRIALGTFAAEAGADWRQVISVTEASYNGVPVLYKLQCRS